MVRSQQASQEDAEFDVFLSYNSEDKAAVQNIANQLKQQGIQPWFDQEQMRPGLLAQGSLEAQLRQSKAAAVFIGRHGIGQWQREEIAALVSKAVGDPNYPVIPVFLPDAPPSADADVPPFLKNRTWVDFRQSEPDPLAHLIWGISSKKSEPQLDVNALVEAIRDKIRSRIRHDCGSMRVLDMTQPIELTGDRGIYTNVNILERLTGRRRLEIEQLLRNSTIEEFERFGLSQVTEKRVSGLEAVKQYSKLMVLGKPGAGKTTFLKYLAMTCIENFEFGDRVPIFVTLKRFAELDERPDLTSYIRSIVKTEHSEQLLNQGKLLILLDGLDEVREEDTQRIIRKIEQFSSDYPQNQFVMTCRIASKEYTFEKFTEVEVADFDDEQIATFVLNWFRCKNPEYAEERSTKLLENLDRNEPIKELASNPLLLTLICLECEESLEFPKNRAELYDRGLRVLLTKWDTSRRINRDQIYKKLSLKRKEDLLSQVALTTFVRKEYFIKQWILESHITNYIRNLPDVETDPEALQIDSEAVLKSIESQHGLLVARATGIYSFSHLTFQEYFVAREMINKSDYSPLLNGIAEKRWREVCLLTMNILPNANHLLLQIKRSVDATISKDDQLQQFLAWILQKSLSISSPYSQAAIRAHYFSLGNYIVAKYQDFTLAFDIAPELDLDLDLARAHRGNGRAKDLAFDRFLTRTLVSLDNYSLKEIIQIADDLMINSELRRKLQEAYNKILKSNIEDRSKLIISIREIVIEHRNIGHDWQFTNAQNVLL